jgi:capsular polysaccharide biosynthesis protein
VLVGLHGAQLYNGLFMPAGKALVEVRPFGFWGVSVFWD